MKKEKCSRCNKMVFGYGYDNDSKAIVCYECCAIKDENYMKEHGKIIMYLTGKDNKKEVTNWPGSLRIVVRYSKEGKHNIARVRQDVWFDFDGFLWHGVQYGDNTQLCYCRKTKQKLENVA